MPQKTPAASPLAPPATPLAKLIVAFGVVAERIAAHKETREAVELVLGYERNRVPSDIPVGFGVPTDQVHAMACKWTGQRKGLEDAAFSLLDPDYIAEQRELLRSEIEANQAKENES